MYAQKSIIKYTDELAAATAVPGGGSAAALAGACGLALVSMVCNFTLRSEKYKRVWPEIGQINQNAELIRKKMVRLIDDDCIAYSYVSRAFQMSKANPSQKQKRRAAIQNALKKANEVPLEICRLAKQGMDLCQQLIGIANQNLISDIGVAANLLSASFESALLNVQINMNAIIDEEYINNIKCIFEPIYLELNHLKEHLNVEAQKIFRVTI